jgi:hypothetical protein
MTFQFTFAWGRSFAVSRTLGLGVFLLEIKGSTRTYTTLDSNEFEGCYEKKGARANGHGVPM